MSSINQTMILDHWERTDPARVERLKGTSSLQAALRDAENLMLDDLITVRLSLREQNPTPPEMPYKERLAVETRVHDQAIEIVTNRYLPKEQTSD